MENKTNINDINLMDNSALSTRKEYIQVAIKNQNLSLDDLIKREEEINQQVKEKFEELKYIINGAFEAHNSKLDDTKLTELANALVLLSKYGSVLVQNAGRVQNLKLEKEACKSLIKQKRKRDKVSNPTLKNLSTTASSNNANIFTTKNIQENEGK